MTADGTTVTIADDVLYGASQIALFLGWKARKVYQAREEGWSAPIRKREGMGIYAFKSELTAWLKADETLQRPTPRIIMRPTERQLTQDATAKQAAHDERVRRANADLEKALEALGSAKPATVRARSAQATQERALELAAAPKPNRKRRLTKLNRPVGA